MLTVREMTLDDLDIILQNEVELYTKPWQKKDFEYELQSNPFAYYFVLEDKDSKTMIGYYGLWIKFEFSEVTKVSIFKKFQGLKLSKILMQDIENRARAAQCVNITLEVRVSNEKAINLYHVSGFKDASIRKKYYDNGEDAILMIKELD